ncbi:MAG: hypothetical protein RL653_4407 [Pseudomonadota bacterium]
MPPSVRQRTEFQRNRTAPWVPRLQGGMAHTTDIGIQLGAGRQVLAQVEGFTVATDQPAELGGAGAFPSPYNLFLASLGTCAGVFVQGFCQKRGIPTEGISLRQKMRYGEDGVLAAVDVEVVLPPGFPDRYRDAVTRAAEGCSVKKAIAAQPTFVVRTVGT